MNRLDDNKIKYLSRILFAIGFIVIWQILYSLKIWPEILFPSPVKVCLAFYKAIFNKGLLPMVLHSLWLLLKGLALGILVAFFLSAFSLSNKLFYSAYDMVVSTFDLIPGIALIPIAILWMGIGDEAIIFMVFHSVVWPLSRSILDGFKEVPKLYVEVGKNIGLTGMRLITGVYLPATLPKIFSGVKVGWARAWRGLISAEMVFGGGSALGIGYFITDRRTNLDIAGILAAILVIIIIGILVEHGVFNTIEKMTLKKWGMIQ